MIDELHEWGIKEEEAIKAMPHTIDRYRRAVELAETYIKNNCDNGAYRVLSDVIYILRRSTEPESDDLWQRAWFGLAALHNSNNDYIADKAGELMSELLE